MTRRQDRWSALVMGLALVGVVGGGPLSGPADQIDAGTFNLFLNGAPIGEERFVIRADRAGASGPIYRAGAELHLKLDGQTMRVSVALEALGWCCRPRRYEAEFNGSEGTTIVGTLSGDRMRMEMNSPRGEEMKEYLVRGNTAIVERYIAHHYYFVAKLLGEATSARATLITPHDRQQLTATITDDGTAPVSLRGVERELRHIVVTGTGTERHIWLDGDRLMKVEVPDLAFLAVRTDVHATGQ